jgi:hypothetical protein
VRVEQILDLFAEMFSPLRMMMSFRRPVMTT